MSEQQPSTSEVTTPEVAQVAVRYVPGSGAVVVRGDVLVALPGAPLDAAAALWRALDGTPGVMEVLQAVSVAFDAGLAALPAFAAVVRAGDRTQVLVRGGLEVTVDTVDTVDSVGAGTGTAARPVLVDGTDVTTWVERTLPDVRGVVVRLGHDVLSAAEAAASDSLLPFAGGVVRADVAVLGTPAVDGEVGTGHADGLGHADGTVVDAVPAVPAVPVLRAVPVLPTVPVPSAVPAVPAAPVAPVPVLTGVPALDEIPAAPDGAATASDLASDPSSDPAWDVAEGADAPADEPEPQGADDVSPETLVDLPAAVADAAEVATAGLEPEASTPELPPVPDPDAPVAPADDEYGSLWETTIHRSVEEAAVRLFEDEEGGAPQGLVSGVPTSFAPVPAPPVPGEPAPAAPSAPAPGIVTGAVPTVDPGPVPAPPDGFDHDGNTVVSAALADLRAVAAAARSAEPAAPSDSPEASTGPTILARACASGHANPPSREVCSVCGGPLSGDTRPLPRPALGRVRVSTGQVVELDRPLVVGRRPRSPRAAGADAAHRVVTVPSPQQDISRSHVEVRLEGWYVLAVDLDTTNGTTLLRAGQEPLRMHPNEPVLVVTGDMVDLGDGATLTFEAIP